MPSKVVMILGESGSGKSTTFRTLPPEKTIYINSDMKALPFKPKGYIKGTNYFETSNYDTIKKLIVAYKDGRVKSDYFVIDTINAFMTDYEMGYAFKLRNTGEEAFRRWDDLATNTFNIIKDLNSLPEHMIIFVLGHITLYTNIDGLQKKCLATSGKKLDSIKLETKLPIVLYTSVVHGKNGQNEYCLETQCNMSTGKSPMGMFEEFLVPNDGLFLAKKINNYYKIEGENNE